jgi:pyrroline-5-carboxylate reductase
MRPFNKMIMKNSRIAIIGGGNLGSAVAEGLIKSKFVTPDQITVTRRNIESLAHLKVQGVHITSDNAAAIKKSDVVIIALKPYNVREVLVGLKEHFDPKKHIVISVVTGVLFKY